MTQNTNNYFCVRSVTYWWGSSRNTVARLPHRLSRAVDSWGFSNGADNNAVINIPKTTVNINVAGSGSVNYVEGTANRNSNEQLMKVGSLKSIKWPTGGQTKFDLEANNIAEIQYGAPEEPPRSVRNLPELSFCDNQSLDCCNGFSGTAKQTATTITQEIYDRGFWLLKVRDDNCFDDEAPDYIHTTVVVKLWKVGSRPIEIIRERVRFPRPYDPRQNVRQFSYDLRELIAGSRLGIFSGEISVTCFYLLR